MASRAKSYRSGKSTRPRAFRARSGGIDRRRILCYEHKSRLRDEALRIPRIYRKEPFMRGLTWFGLAIAAACWAAPATTGTMKAETEQPKADKHDAKILRDALKDVVNAGAQLFNKDGDHAGCYRLYQGRAHLAKAFPRVGHAKGNRGRASRRRDVAALQRSRVRPAQDD